MEFDYNYDYYTPEFGAAAGTAGTAFLIVGIIYLLTIGLSILCYVFQSVGLYSIAKRRGIRKAWLSWLPLGNLWIMGSISDQYQYVVKGQVRNRRKALLGLSIGTYLTMIPFYVLYFVSLIGLSTGMVDEASAIGGLLIAVVLALVMMVLAIILTVFQYIALYDLFCSCTPDNAVLFLVLSILFNITLPFFLFGCRKKDGGMPPRKPVQPTYQPPVYQNIPQPPVNEMPAPETTWQQSDETEG